MEAAVTKGSGVTSIDPHLAAGLRKRLVRESQSHLDATLTRLVNDVIAKGCQRSGSTHRRIVGFVKQQFGGRLIHEGSAGSGRREVWSCELLLPDAGDLTWSALALVRVDIPRRHLGPIYSKPIGVRVSQHAIERVLLRHRSCGWTVGALTAELRPALDIASRWRAEHLIPPIGHWQLPTFHGLAFVTSEQVDAPLQITTWVREDQLGTEQKSARGEVLDRFKRYHSATSQRSIRVVCGPKTPLVQACGTGLGG